MLTDNEIIKALECCKKLTHNGWSKNQKICEEECPYKANCYDEEKNINMIADAVDLINRQQAEVERLKRLLERAEKGQITLSKQCYKSGIKEFAERLEGNFAGGWLEMDEDWFEKIVKEMVGEDETT